MLRYFRKILIDIITMELWTRIADRHNSFFSRFLATLSPTVHPELARVQIHTMDEVDVVSANGEVQSASVTVHIHPAHSSETRLPPLRAFTLWNNSLPSFGSITGRGVHYVEAIRNPLAPEVKDFKCLITGKQASSSHNLLLHTSVQIGAVCNDAVNWILCIGICRLNSGEGT